MMLAVGEHVLGDLEPQWVRMTSGLAGGVGGTHEEMCGALSGGVMVIGGAFGRAGLDEDDEPARNLAARYRERFLVEFQYTRCAPLREIVKGPDGLGSCAVVVERAAMILLDMLDQAEQGF
jgi:C_GCAxxG_C_C family probable redox protein